MARPVTIAALQLPAWTEGGTPSEQKAFRLGQIERWLHEAGRAGAAVAAMGERSTTHGIAVPPGDGAVCEEAYDGPSATLARRLAREYALAIVLPIVARCRGRVQNLALVIARDGEIVGHYANVHPTRAELAQGIVAGDHFPVFDLDFGRIGVVICHDLSFPESTRVLGVRRAEIIFWPTLWSGWGEELCNAVIRSRAIDNGCYLVQANMGQPVGKAWRPGLLLGNSGVIGPDGLTLSSADRHVGMSLATVDLDRPRLAHSFSMSGEHEFRASMLADRRPDAYRPITDPAALPAPLADGLGAARS